MEGISFDNEEKISTTKYSLKKKPYLIRLIISTGIVHDDKHAEYMLLAMVALLIIVAISIFNFGNSSEQIKVPLYKINSAMQLTGRH